MNFLESLEKVVKHYSQWGNVLAVVHTQMQKDWHSRRFHGRDNVKFISPGTTAMGFRADYIIVDGLDEEADERTLAWFRQGVLQRLAPNGQVIRHGYVIR